MNGIAAPVLLCLFAALGIVALLLILVLRRLAAPTPGAPDAALAADLAALRDGKAAAERRLAVEEQKALRVPALEGELEECRRLLEEARQGKAESDAGLAGRIQAVAGLQEMEKQVRTALAAAEAEGRGLQARLESLVQEKAKADADLAEARESLARTTETLEETRGRLREEQQRSAAAAVEFRTLQEDKARTDEALASRTETVAGQQEMEKQLRAGLAAAEADERKLQARLEVLAQENAKAGADLAEVRESLVRMAETLEETRGRLREEQQRSAAVAAEFRALQEEKARTDEALASRTETVAGLQEMEKQLRAGLASAEAEGRGLQVRLETLAQEKAKAGADLAEVRESLARTTETLEETRGRLREEQRLGAAAAAEFRALQEEKARTDEALASRAGTLAGLQDMEKQLRGQLAAAEETGRGLQVRLETLMQEKAEQEKERAKLAETLLQERQQSQEKLALLAEARERMGTEFRVLAEEIMARHGAAFTAQNREQLDGVLTPLKDKMAEFQQGLTAAHNESLRDRATLAEQIRSLTESSATMSQETQNLTRALKGEAQVQGAWGEMILATILEKSGLREGEEYFAQESHTGEEGERIRPDVIVNLPGGEKVIIDSKVSLVAFEEYVGAGSEADRTGAMQRHLASLRNHIKTLGSKEYHANAGSRLDYVLMFIPIEGALAAALQTDPALTSLAAEKNVAIATPTTLMIALRTVANVWKVERRNRNAEAIAARAGRLYDKFCGFVADLGDIQIGIKDTQNAYNAAMNKLSQGKGNLVNQAEQLKSLGAKTNKSLPEALRLDAGEPADAPGGALGENGAEPEGSPMEPAESV